MTKRTEPELTDDEIAGYYDTTDVGHDDSPLERVAAARAPMIVRSVRFDRDTMRQLRAVAESRGIGVTELIRLWVEERLRQESATDDLVIEVSMRTLLDTVAGAVSAAVEPAARRALAAEQSKPVARATVDRPKRRRSSAGGSEIAGTVGGEGVDLPGG